MVLGESLTLGFQALTWSANKAGDEEEKDLGRGEITLSILFALVVFGVLFVALPALVAEALVGDRELAFAATESVIRLAVLIGYLWLLGRSKEIRRVFCYHGAEHMTIHAYEADDPLDVESVSKYPPEHPRCGTAFLMLVMIVAIVLFTALGKPGWPVLVGSRIIGIPVVAGVSYEILKWSGLHHRSWLGRVVAAPGIWLQRLTTAVPEPLMIEVAVASLLAALEPEEADRVVAAGGVPEAAVAARSATV